MKAKTRDKTLISATIIDVHILVIEMKRLIHVRALCEVLSKQWLDEQK